LPSHNLAGCFKVESSKSVMLSTKEAAEKLTAAGFKCNANEVAQLARDGLLTNATKNKGKWEIPPEIIEPHNIQLLKRKKRLKVIRNWIGVGSIAAFIAFLAAVVSGAKDSLDLFKDYIFPRPTSTIEASVNIENSPKISRMDGDFNIAIAEFRQVTGQSDEGRQISNKLFSFLDNEYRSTDFGLQVKVAHENIPILAGKEEAAKLADEINAHVVIYGSVYVNQDVAELWPEFYIADRFKGNETGELIGQHQLGHPITFSLSSTFYGDKVNTELRSRATILTSFTQGLVYLSNGDSVAALHFFQKAITNAEEGEIFKGQEVLYLAASVASSLQGNFEQAIAYVERVIRSLNPEYARAYIARGNIYYSQAVKVWPPDERNLDLALKDYNQAFKAQEKPDGALVLDKVNYSLGNIYLVQAQQQNRSNLFAKAIEHYNKVVERYKITKNERMKDIVAQTYFNLGIIYEKQNRYSEAKDAYQQCMALASDPVLKSDAEKQLDIIK
jgi:tetratricopeptide (TPR) repeat protein